MSQGKLQQVANPRDIYNRPTNGFVASFVGENNGFEGTVIGADGAEAVIETAVGRLKGRRGAGIVVGSKATVFIRPERLRIAANGEAPVISADVASQAFEGNATQLFLRGPANKMISVSLSRRDDIGAVTQGQKLGLSYAAKDAVILVAGAAR